MDKYFTVKCNNIKDDLARSCGEFMPGGHIGVCCLSKDRKYAESVMSGISEFEYKITFFEYPDGIEADVENSLDLVNAADDIRLLVGIGDKTIASLAALSTLSRDWTYMLVADSPDLYGVAYQIEYGEYLGRVAAPMKVLIDLKSVEDSGEYSSAVGSILAHRVALIEKKYANRLCRRFDEKKLESEQNLLDKVIADGDMSDRRRIADGILEYADLEKDPYLSSVDVMNSLLKEVCMPQNEGDCRLISAIIMLKYFKTVMSVDNYLLSIPTEVSAKCRRLSKISGRDISEIIRNVECRKYERKLIYIHTEYREDVLAEINSLENKLPKIIKSAKRFMEDVGYHLGDDFDSGAMVEIARNISPLTDEYSIAAMADILGI